MNTTYKVNRIRVEVICPKCKNFVVTANPKWKYAIDNGSELVCDHCHSHFKIVFELLDRAGEQRTEAETTGIREPLLFAVLCLACDKWYDGKKYSECPHKASHS